MMEQQEKKYKVTRRISDRDNLEICKGNYEECRTFYEEWKDVWRPFIVRSGDDYFIARTRDGGEVRFKIISFGPASKPVLIRLYDTLSNRFNGKVNRVAKSNLSMTEIEMINNLGLIEVNEKTTVREVLRALRQYLNIK